ncbi:MAG TPA: hypothetical protein VHV47_12585 [Opitutaceae bacterium]|jgi:hypothetical protein|nr:hypothetical protein [Opitutaceae bacterium]
MYPSRQLTLLAARRETLRTRIEFRRMECREAGFHLGQGVRHLLTWGRLLRLGGMAGAVGLGWFGLRRSRHRNGDSGEEGEAESPSWLGRIARWAPVALRLARLASLRF